ncbi:HEAT repeat domain-containing protein [Halorubrum sp. SS7]|uniref:HEAT repeat domain-containing protein n=1 Tax=Halorubrum sp. SS7 TaxID=2518119 RepID=UPI0010F6472C|nr:HEAT repeat domain-containing protein [Halorubrum sp. SS7]TKX57897.1 HEAT repeat domain-containing protein [Halorubrum sp. SS7]
MDDASRTGERSGAEDSGGADRDRRDDGGPAAVTRLNPRRFDAAARREAAEALGNPSASMSADEGRIVDALFETALDDPDDAVRAAAIESLYFHGDDHVDRVARRIAERGAAGDADGEGREAGAVAAFSRWLDRDRAAYRMVAATGLAAAGGEDAAPRLREAFDDDDARVRARAVSGYARAGGEAVEAVRPLVTEPNELVRGAAVDALVAMDTDDAVELLARAARRGSERLRLAVVDGLADLDRRDAAGVLLGSLRDPSERVRRAAAASIAAVIAEAGAVPAGDVRDRLLSERPFEADGLLASFRAVAAERTAADRAGGGGRTGGGPPDRVGADARRHAAWLYCELLEAADPAAADRSAAVEWLIDALDHRDRLVADLAAAYLPRVVSADAADAGRPEGPAEPPLGLDVERELRALASDGSAAEAARERARAVLRRFKRSVVETAADRHVEYVYVRWPADYTERYEE